MKHLTEDSKFLQKSKSILHSNLRGIAKIPLFFFKFSLDIITSYHYIIGIKIRKELINNMSDYSNVKVYVGTYAKYNCGFIDGKWFTPADYDSYEDFIKALRDFHSDESDPEFMYQDAEYLPRGLYCESDFDEETFDYCKYVSENPENAYGAYCWVENFNDGWNADNFESSFMGEYDSAEDYCWQYIEDCGGISEAINRDTLEMYFDYENFGREIKMDLDEEDEWESQLLDMSDYDCGAEYIDSYGGIEQMNDSTIENYFDIESFARDCQFDGSFDYYDGCVFINY